MGTLYRLIAVSISVRLRSDRHDVLVPLTGRSSITTAVTRDGMTMFAPLLRLAGWLVSMGFIGREPVNLAIDFIEQRFHPATASGVAIMSGYRDGEDLPRIRASGATTESPRLGTEPILVLASF